MTLHHIGPVDDIPVGEARTYVVEGTEVAVYRLRNGTLRALGGVCPHRGGPLADGLSDDRVVVCPLHGHTYDLSTGAELTVGAQKVRTYTVSTNGDNIHIDTRPDT